MINFGDWAGSIVPPGIDGGGTGAHACSPVYKAARGAVSWIRCKAIIRKKNMMLHKGIVIEADCGFCHGSSGSRRTWDTFNISTCFLLTPHWWTTRHCCRYHLFLLRLFSNQWNVESSFSILSHHYLLRNVAYRVAKCLEIIIPT